MKARNGKIARLPRSLREQVNERLERCEAGPKLLAWLNALAEVQQVLAEDFAGEPITKQNLSQWRRGGFQEWLARQDLLGAVENVGELSGDMGIAETDLVDQVAGTLAAHYASLLGRWNGQCTEEFEARAKVLNGLCRSVTQLQKAIYAADRETFEMRQREEQLEKENEEEKRKKLMGVVMSPLWQGNWAKIFGGGEGGEKMAELIQLIQRGDWAALDKLHAALRERNRMDATTEAESQPVAASQSDETENGADGVAAVATSNNQHINGL